MNGDTESCTAATVPATRTLRSIDQPAHPSWCSLPADHPFVLTDDGVETRGHFRDLFAPGEHEGFLIVRQTEVRSVSTGQSVFEPQVVFYEGRELADGEVHHLATWLANFVTEHGLTSAGGA